MTQETDGKLIAELRECIEEIRGELKAERAKRRQEQISLINIIIQTVEEPRRQKLIASLKTVQRHLLEGGNGQAQ